MSDRLKVVRAQLTNVEEIDMGPVPTASETSDYWQTPPQDYVPDDYPPAPPQDEQGPIDPVERAAEQPMNDVGNSARFVIHFGDDCISVPGVGWYAWTGSHWARDEHALSVRAKAQKLHPLIEEEVRYIRPTEDQAPLAERRTELQSRFSALQKARGSRILTDSEELDLINIPSQVASLNKLLDSLDKQFGRRITFAKDTGNSGRIDKLLQESTTKLSVDFARLDASPLEVNCDSGLLQFSTLGDGISKTSVVDLLPHERGQYITKKVPVEWDPDAPAPLWEAFLERIQPDVEMRSFLQRWLGLSMTSLKTSHLAFFYGGGANGKSVLVDTIARVLSGYAAGLKIESITGSNKRGGAEATPDLVPLMGARFVRTSEPDHGVQLQEGLIKQMTGGEPIQVRPMYGAQIDLDPTWKITMSGNHRPEIKGGDDGIWRRILLVQFDVQIPKAERDERLPEKLWAERAGIFRWLVEGLRDYLEVGLMPPESVLNATDEYRQDSDPLAAFLMTVCNVTGQPHDKILAAELVEAVNYYFLERGMNGWKPATITRQMSTKAKQWKHPETALRFTKSKANLSQYLGISLTDDFRRRFEAAPKDARGLRVSVGYDDTSNSPYAPDPQADF